MGYDELIDWINDNKLRVGVYFSVNDLDHLARGGRLSQASATIGNALKIKPMLTINSEGKIEVIAKYQGMRKAMKQLVSRMEEEWDPAFGPYVLICHADDEERADCLRSMVEERFPEAVIETGMVDPIIGMHTGPGMISLCFWAKDRR